MNSAACVDGYTVYSVGMNEPCRRGKKTSVFHVIALDGSKERKLDEIELERLPYSIMS